MHAVLTSDAQRNHSSKVIRGHYFLFTNEEKVGQFKNSCITIVLKTSTKISKFLGNKTASKTPSFQESSAKHPLLTKHLCAQALTLKKRERVLQDGFMKITIKSGTPAQKVIRDPNKDITVCCTV